MSHASRYAIVPEVPAEIRDRLVSHRAGDIAEYLRTLEILHPGLFDAMVRIINMLESVPGVKRTSVDFDEEDVLVPVTIWARTTFSLDERETQMVALEEMADEILKHYPDLVLVAIL